MISSKEKSIAIIGSGISGLVSAKSAIENGFKKIVVFEKCSDLGGLWGGGNGMWDSLTTNISLYCCMFSDFPWEEDMYKNAKHGYFPTHKEVYKYISGYADTFNLRSFIKFNCEVLNVKRTSNHNFILEYKDNNNVDINSQNNIIMEFDYIIVASGIFSREIIPKIPGDETFPGTRIHSSKYKNSTPYTGKSVAIIGSSSSGCEIASELASKNVKVVTFSRRNHYVIPKMVPLSGRSTTVPIDYASYSRSKYYNDKRSFSEKNNSKANWLGLIGKQQDIESLKVREDPKVSQIYVSISDEFVELVRSEKIMYHPTKVSRIEGNRLYYKIGDDNTNELHEDVDEIIYCSGYSVNLNYLDKEILEKIEFNANDLLLPIVASKAVLCRDIPNIAFVGMYKGPYFGTCEIQARYATGIFAGNVKEPTKEELEQSINEERAIRNDITRPQFPHQDYVFFVDKIAKAMNVLPDMETLEKDDPELHRLIWNGFYSTASLRLFGFGSENTRDKAILFLQNIANHFKTN